MELHNTSIAVESERRGAAEYDQQADPKNPKFTRQGIPQDLEINPRVGSMTMTRPSHAALMLLATWLSRRTPVRHPDERKNLASMHSDGLYERLPRERGL
jgi:hypothetical protein